MDRSEDIEHLLRSMEKRFGESSDGARQMFAMLVRATLAYRDKLVDEQQEPLTIGETQQALDAFMVIIKTQRFPAIEGSRVKDLVLLWLDELRKTIHH